MAMNKPIVAASNISIDQKEQIKEKIDMMVIFSFYITQSVTHLVTNPMNTRKYTADDEELTVHKCPVFKNRRVCCTGFDAKKREQLKIITDNGAHEGNQSIPPKIPVNIIETKRNETGCIQEESIKPILEGETFKLVGYTVEEKEKVRAIVEEMRGNVMRHSYNVCSQVRHRPTEIVTVCRRDCHNKNRLLDVPYYHQPFFVTHSQWLLKF
ncbi:hypothetical protein CBL_20684 [Carabus blaptoides fortunei]